MKALAKGKHVLLEKPAVVNATEAESLFRSTLLQGPQAPILLEALHFRFQPTWQYFESLVDRDNIQVVTTVARLPAYMISEGIRFNYDLGGGNLLDLGTYPIYAMRHVMGAEPDECTKCEVRISSHGQLCDEAAEASFVFPSGRTGIVMTDLQASATTFPTFNITVLHKAVAAEDIELPAGQKKERIRKLTLYNFLMSSFWHRLDIEDEFVVREVKSGNVVKRWTKKQSKKIYTFKDAGIDQPSEDYWTSYRHQLEQFVSHVRGQQGSGLWVPYEDSLSHAKMIDMAYEKSSLPLRRTSKYVPS